MKTKKWNGYAAVTGMVFALLFLNSCGKDELPSADPSGRFQLNISSTSGIGIPSNGKTKTLFVDGDSIRFTTKFYVAAYHNDHYILIEPLSNNQYEYITDIYTLEDPYHYYYTYYYPANVSTDSIPAGNQQWRTVKNDMNQSQLLLFGSSIFKEPQILFLPFNQDQYIIFRKKMPDDHLYFWVRIRYTTSLYMFTLTIMDGKYQMGAITTSQ